MPSTPLPSANFGPKRCFLVSYSPNPSCLPNLKLLASMNAEINRGSKFLHAPHSPDPANLGCFLIRYSRNPSCVPNLKLLPSDGCRNKWVQNFSGCSPSPFLLPILVLKLFLASNSLYSSGIRISV